MYSRTWDWSKRTSSPMPVVMAANVLLAVLAFFREVMLGRLMGTTGSADAFLLALYVVDLEANLILSASILAAAVPLLSPLVAAGDSREFVRTVNSAAGILLLVGLVLAGVNALGAEFIVKTLGAGLDGATRRAAAGMLIMMLPLFPCYALFGLLSACLYVRSDFLAPAFGPVLLNLVFLVGSGVTFSRFGLLSLAAWQCAGTAVMVLLQWAALRRVRVSFTPTLDLDFTEVKRLMRSTASIGFAQALTHLGFLVERGMAGGLGEGVISSLYYSFKISQVPVWVFVAAVSTVAFPSFALCAADADRSGLSKTLERATRLTALVTFPATAFMIVCGRPLVATLLMRGAFTGASLNSTSLILKGYAVVPIIQGFSYLFLRLCYALRETRGVIWSAFAGSIAMICTDAVLVPRVGPVGFGIGAAVGFLGSTIVSAAHTRPYMEKGTWRRLWNSTMCSAASSLPMSVIMWLSGRSWVAVVETLSQTERILRVGGTFCLGCATYVIVRLVLSTEDVSLLFPGRGSRRPGSR